MSSGGTQRPPAARMGWEAPDCRAGDAQGELCCAKCRERARFKRPPAGRSCRYRAQTSGHPIAALKLGAQEGAEDAEMG